VSSEAISELRAQLSIFENHRSLAKFEIREHCEIGRRQVHEPLPFAKVSLPDADRIIVADLSETVVSRKHLRIQILEGNKVKLRNDSSKNSVPILGESRLNPNESTIVDLPVAFEIGDRVLRITPIVQEDLHLQTLQAATCAPGHSSQLMAGRSLLNVAVPSTPGSTPIQESFLFDWLQAAMDVFQSAASSVDFLSKAARAAIELVGLNSAAILLYGNGQWNLAARECRQGDPVNPDWFASQTMLQRVLEQKRTFFHTPASDSNVAASLLQVQSIVAAPFLDRDGEVLGVLYGERRSGLNAVGNAPIRELDAKLVELLAYGVASGLARIEQEKLLIAERVRFEQFFTPELARMLEARGNEMLAAKDAEISVLFCDIQGFSRISAANGAAIAIEWVCDVLSELSDCVAEHQGVLVDYSGDALEALWGAPLATPEHATLACRTALRMKQTLPGINARWRSRLGEETDVAIGIHTGMAKVGNIGSRRKYKYGALGTPVNLASRIQGATKYVGCSMLVSGATLSRVTSPFASRRLGSIRTVNIEQPVDIHELHFGNVPDWEELKSRYEEALTLFENGSLAAAISTLEELGRRFPMDIPINKLLQRAGQWSARKDPFDSVWTLDGK
jgi:adenylate cyclase